MRRETSQLQRNLIAAIIKDPSQAGRIFASVPESQFDPPLHHLTQAMLRLRLAKVPISVAALGEQMRLDGTLPGFGLGDIHMLTLTATTDPDSVEFALSTLAREVRLRAIWRLTTQMAQRVEGDEDTDDEEILRYLIEEGERILAGAQSLNRDIYVPTLAEFLDVDEEPYDWVIPDLLEHGDRLIMTGGEGIGKSTVLRQIGVSAAAGIHPFDHYVTPRKRVLIVDCENNPVPIRRNLRPLRTAAARMGSDPGDWLHIEARPEGMTLDRPSDETELVNIVTSVAPDLLIIGPIYRLYSRDGNEEETGRSVSRVLDRCRSITNCAIVTEAHTPHQSGGERSLRPVGTSLWMRWPEFGYGLRRNDDWTPSHRSVDVIPWRGDRDERPSWPLRLGQGGGLPWHREINHGLSLPEVEPDNRYGD